MTEVQEKQRQNIKFGYILSNTETVWILQWKSTVRGKLSFFEEEQCREDFASEFLHRGKNLQKTSIIKKSEPQAVIHVVQNSCFLSYVGVSECGDGMILHVYRVNQTVVERQIFEPHDLKDWVRLLRQEALPFILNTHHLVDSKYPDRTACSRYLSKKDCCLPRKRTSSFSLKSTRCSYTTKVKKARKV